MNQHFEELWEAAENFFKDKDDDIGMIINHLLIKINLYKEISRQPSQSEEELKKIKSHLMGEILLTLTHFSYKEQIDVFNALNTALYFSKIEKYENHSLP